MVILDNSPGSSVKHTYDYDWSLSSDESSDESNSEGDVEDDREEEESEDQGVEGQDEPRQADEDRSEVKGDGTNQAQDEDYETEEQVEEVDEGFSTEAAESRTVTSLPLASGTQIAAVPIVGALNLANVDLDDQKLPIRSPNTFLMRIFFFLRPSNRILTHHF